MVAIQFYLEKNKLGWCLLEDEQFKQFKYVLDNTMKDRAHRCIDVVKKQASVISYKSQNKMWAKGILGGNDPQQLLNTVLYLVGINCALRACDEHYSLHRIGHDSQFEIVYDGEGVKCLLYTEDFNTKTNKDGLKDKNKERKSLGISIKGLPSQDFPEIHEIVS